MQSWSRRTAVLALLVPLAVESPVLAGTSLNEVGALLVYPIIIGSAVQETFVTVTNAGPSAVVAHVAYINGDTTPISEGGAGYCYECDFDLPLSGSDTETLVITKTPSGIAIQSEDLNLSLSCPFPYGMIVLSLEDVDGNVLTENVLLGEEVVVDYATGTTYSIPAISFQGGNGGNSDREYSFDDQEYSKLPRVWLRPTSWLRIWGRVASPRNWHCSRSVSNASSRRSLIAMWWGSTPTRMPSPRRSSSAAGTWSDCVRSARSSVTLTSDFTAIWTRMAGCS